MEIYLVRHTRPAIAEGTCYGWADIGLAESFAEEAREVAGKIPAQIDSIYSSPLLRCRQLATSLFRGREIMIREELREIHFGKWELMPWNKIPPPELDPWMQDFVHARPPGGESYLDLYARAVATLHVICAAGERAVIITHAGVIRCMLSYVHATDLASSFDLYKPAYGSVIRIGAGGVK